MIRGFTLIEIVVSLGVLGVMFVAAAGLLKYPARGIDAEVTMLVGALQNARSRAMESINSNAHGVLLEESRVCIFSQATRECDIAFDRQRAVQISGLDELRFDRVSGSTDYKIINVSNGTTVKVVRVLETGAIEW